MYWKIIENHPDLRFYKKVNAEYVSFSNPLFEDEVQVQSVKNCRLNFQFNNGYNKIHFTQFIASIKNVYLEPTFFILIKKFNILIKESIVFEWYKVSFRKFISHFFLRQCSKVEKAVLFDAKVGKNIFHFYNDILPKIFVSVPGFSNIQFLIGEELYYSKLFQYFLQFDFVKNNNWKIISKNKFLFVKEMFLIKVPEYDAEKLKLIADEALSKNEIDGSNNLKLFINRKESTGRTISNFKAIEPILLKNNFVILYLEDLNIAEQIEFFSKAKVIVGIHGAGLTNMIFSYRNKPKILEVTASDYIPTHYYWLANSFSFEYKLFLGDNLIHENDKQKFAIDIKRFTNIITKFE